MPPNPTTTPRTRMPPATTPTSSKGGARPKKETLHFLAASSSTTSVDAARTLLERGANVNAIDREGATPLHYACVHDNVAMAQLFLTFGADPMSADKLGRTAYSIAKGNTLRFLRRYKKASVPQRLGFFRRFFSCHSRNDTFFIVRKNQETVQHPTALAETASTSFHRGNPITKSYRNAKKKIRATFHAIRRSRSNSTATLQDVVLTSEGYRTVTTPIRVGQKKNPASAKRSMSVSDLPGRIPDKGVIREEDRKRMTPVKKQNPRNQTPMRSQSQDKGLETTGLVAMPRNHMAYYQDPRAKVAGLRPAPSAPPLSPEELKTPNTHRSKSKSPVENGRTPKIQKTPKTPRSKSKSPVEIQKTPKSRSKSPAGPSKTPPRARSKSPAANTTAYYTAEEESLELIGNNMERLNLGPKTPSTSSSEESNEPLTPTTVDDGEMRKIKRLRDVEFKSELRKFGISPAGPLDARTRRLYEKKLLIERRKITSRGYSPDADVSATRNSPQLELVLRNGFIPSEFAARALRCDESIRKEFSGNGFGYTAFCYLIMDPRVLGSKVDTLTLDTFVKSIFYVGKGSKNRPLAHFIDARNERRDGSSKIKTCEKLRTIDELWTLGFGIPRHEIAHGVSDEEAFVREASIIEAIKLTNLRNKKSGEFHGIAKNWDQITKAEYGTFLLDRALSTLKLEGIRLITEDNLPDTIYPYVTNRRGAGARTPKTPK